jgi:MraZ protein
MFLGEYEHSLDAKQRLAVPAEVREIWNEERHGAGLVAAPGPNGSLWLWPERTFGQIAEKFDTGLLAAEGLVQFERHVFSKAARVPFDSAGRIRIPDRLLKQFGLKSQVVVLGVRDHLEVMDLESWRQEEAAAPPSTDIWRQARAAHAAERRNG